MTKHGTVERLRPFGGTIFAEMSELANRHGAVNLGQGFPDWDGPDQMLEIARQQIADGNNQYPPGRGFAGLRQAICDDRSARFGQQFDPDRETLVTVGATEGIAAAVLGLVEPGQEVILIEPYYDSYAAAVALAGARRVAVPLVRDGQRFVLDADALRAAVTPNTAMIVVNTPHNPTGTMLSAAELGVVAEVACEHDLLVLADEVYEHLVFDAEHVPVASLPGMRERTVTVSSAAKTFNVTGWKVGWVLASAGLVDGVLAAKQFLTFVGAAPFQPAVEYALHHEQAWVENLRQSLSDKRGRLGIALRSAGFDTLDSAGTYYTCVDLGDGVDGLDFCRRLPETRGVAAVPVSVFTDHPDEWRGIVRFAFCKRDEVLDEAVRRLAASA